ncbi:hypothetical protein GYA54_01390 [Candidatus Kuenenbacteria bacterium]|nr:hypothetical protein [Candidatus Kuenenbacteria bacterium]
MGHKEGETMEHSHRDQIERDWTGQLAIYQKIKQLGAEEYFASVADLAAAFNADDHHVHCMDERTPGGIHCAGSGILLGLDAAAEFCAKSGARGITSHESCGAAAIYARLNGLTGNSDELGVRFAQDLAVKTGLPYVGHLPVKKEHHFARAAYYDGTGIFDSTKAADLPPGFFINRANLPADYAANTEAATAARIAMGDHGYGQLITTQEPFWFFAIAKGELTLGKLMAELEPLKKEFGDKIIIAGFNAPQK